MSGFRDRIAWLLHPKTQAEPDLRVKGRYNTPMEMPLTRIQIGSNIIMYEDMEPLIDPAGLIIPATSKGQWGALYAAGRVQ